MEKPRRHEVEEAISKIEVFVYEARDDFILPRCYAEQKYSYISLKFKGEVWVRAIILESSLYRQHLKAWDSSQSTTLSLFIRDLKRTDSKSNA